MASQITITIESKGCEKLGTKDEVASASGPMPHTLGGNETYKVMAVLKAALTASGFHPNTIEQALELKE